MRRTTSEKGILRPRDTERHIDLRRYPPEPVLGRFVERYWTVHWDLAEPYQVQVIPHPSVNVTFMQPFGGQVHGVGTYPSTHSLHDSGVVFGVKFRPGGFRAMTGRAAASIADRSHPLDVVFGSAVAQLQASVADAREDADRIDIVASFLRERLPNVPDPNYDLVIRAVSEMLDDRGLTRVDEIAGRLGISVRTLQRLFLTYVGVGPKWIIRRYRMHDGAQRLASGDDPATVAAELGWFDQAHFTREFTALIGMSPAAYARANAADLTTA